MSSDLIMASVRRQIVAPWKNFSAIILVWTLSYEPLISKQTKKYRLGVDQLGITRKLTWLILGFGSTPLSQDNVDTRMEAGRPYRLPEFVNELKMLTGNSDSVQKIISLDEANFWCNGYVNKQKSNASTKIGLCHGGIIRSYFFRSETIIVNRPRYAIAGITPHILDRVIKD